MIAISYDPLVDPKLQVTNDREGGNAKRKKSGKLFPAMKGERRGSKRPATECGDGDAVR